MPPASAVGPARTGVVSRVVTIGAPSTGGAVSALASTRRTKPLHHRATTGHVSTHWSTAAKPKKKKKGFFAKLGIFLLVLVILAILFGIGLIWLVVHMVRRAFGRRA
ncbi:hypothetical protein CTZ27_29295 [Streptomyces griseocarneus]|nr:hypothetical protein CTZ27_29295 [Streptomyces griseocarneus]